MGQPEAMFISVEGRLKFELVGSGQNVYERSRRAGDWSSRLKVTFARNGHSSRASNFPRMTANSSDRCVPLPMFMYKHPHIL